MSKPGHSFAWQAGAAERETPVEGRVPLRSVIELRDLTKRFGPPGPEAVTAVDHVNLKVPEGELLVLLGGSGSGKTTTLRMINRLIEPSEGQVYLFGRDAADIPAHELRRQIGYVFQRVGLFPHLSVGENIAITPTLLGWSRDRVDERVDTLLELVELSAAHRDRRPSELSGGQQQRVGVARALAAQPRVMLLDEPFGSLDPTTRATLQQRFLEIKTQLGFTGVFVTHDMAEALLLGDRIAVMRGGRLIQAGTPDELLHAPADDGVRQLVDTPLRQAARLRDLFQPEGNRGASR